jgi:hypothetical protein
MHQNVLHQPSVSEKTFLSRHLLTKIAFALRKITFHAISQSSVTHFAATVGSQSPTTQNKNGSE